MFVILVKNSIKPTDQKELNRCNIAALFFGIIGSLGISILGAFQTGSPGITRTMHYLGGFFAYTFVLIYAWLIAYISHALNKNGKVRLWIWIRHTLATLGSRTLVIFSVGFGLSKLNSNSKHSDLFAIAEWFQIYFAILFLTTLIEDLRQIHFDVKLNELEDGNHFNQDDNYRTSRQ
ncbi:uncharacterized protein LOC143460222 isoform X2 [Clavelina lepadiformis]|uniref:uncharacterized protein LOC143460222 isoform X2 n=1 Tax=Clavelina lepadiformis TaxID=159417 RepID=UPI004041C7FC